MLQVHLPDRGSRQRYMCDHSGRFFCAGGRGKKDYGKQRHNDLGKDACWFSS
jgi:hypothetical protein